MAYPTVPDLQPFTSEMRPNLLGLGQYDQQLIAIEEYLKQLGSYIDENVERIDETLDGHRTSIDQLVTSVDQLTTQVDQLVTLADQHNTAINQLTEQVTQLVSSVNSHQQTLNDHEQRITTNRDDISQLTTEVSDLTDKVDTNDTEFDNLINSSGTYGVPSKISNSNVATTSYNLFHREENGTYTSPVVLAINTLLANLMLAVPNDDQDSFLGWLGDNSADLSTGSPSVKSSAALTVAYESGGSGGGGTMPEQHPDTDANVTASDISHFDGTQAAVGLKKTATGNWVYVG